MTVLRRLKVVSGSSWFVEDGTINSCGSLGGGSVATSGWNKKERPLDKIQTMKLIVEVTALLVVVGVEGYREDNGVNKWSPSYFNYRYFPQPQPYKREISEVGS